MKHLKSPWFWLMVIVVALIALFFVGPTKSTETTENTETAENSTTIHGRVCNIHKTVPLLEASAQHLDQDVLELALTSYNCAIEAGMDEQEILTIINFTMPSTAKRLWVFDLHRNRILFNTWVAHGKGSGDVSPIDFSNEPESHKSSVGLFLTGNIYTGKHGHSLVIYGLEKGFNDKAESRHIVIHSASYVSQARSSTGMGRSWGCPALSVKETEPIIQAIKDGSILFAYYPVPLWMKESTYLNCMNKK